jgi:hypothetical protein
MTHLLGAFCAVGAIFLILEMNKRLDRIVKVTTRPTRDALAGLGR